MQITGSEQQHWAAYGRLVMEDIYRHINSVTNTSLSNSDKRVVHAAFVKFVINSPEAANKYEQDGSALAYEWLSPKLTSKDSFQTWLIAEHLGNNAEIR